LGCLVVLVAAACGNSAPSDGSGTTGGASSATLDVTADNFAFSPTSLSVDPGASVELTFTNNDSPTHSFTADGIGVDLVVDGGSSDSATFTAPDSGTIEWHCKFHSTMKGTITVGGAPASGQTSDQSDDLDY
jgi:plastocyanin